MNSLRLYGTTPFDLFDRIFDDDFLVAGARSPAIDIREEDGKYILEAELPGMSEKDIRLEVKDSVLSISTVSESGDAAEKPAARWIARERREIRFSRSFTLPDHVDVEKIEARFRDGLLTVTLPRKPEASARIVPVKAA